MFRQWKLSLLQTTSDIVTPPPHPPRQLNSYNYTMFRQWKLSLLQTTSDIVTPLPTPPLSIKQLQLNTVQTMETETIQWRKLD